MAECVVMDRDNQIESWHQRRRYILDIADLNDQERTDGSILLGGDEADFISIGDKFNFDQVRGVVFNWGDKRAELVFAALLEHDDTPSPDFLPFTASTVIGEIL